ncbi:histidine kinase [Virgisporangium ochraceum]|uniref:Histidine kinase n=1 Tax=Virgisporangium ochraceum TaxID=65505 RepID=A0A8J4EFW9_9ACTN|nr:histidine kinase [Virgisporangium ochraceum]
MTAVTRFRFIWLWVAVWLVYMIYPIEAAWQHPEPWRRVVGIAAAVLYSAVYLAGFLRLRRSLRGTARRLARPGTVALLGSMAALVVVLAVAVGQPALTALVYLSAMAVFALPTRAAWALVAVLATAALVLPRTVPGWTRNDDLAFQVGIAALAVWGVVQLVRRNTELAAAREEITRLAVADERNRFARDLHDLLGHSLTVVSVKAELAGRLVRLAPDRAETELADIQRLAREALTDVRAAVGGYREVSLDVELARARSALVAAGIEADLPDDTAAVPDERQELFGWVVREGVTNVVRHSGAGRCRVRVGAASVVVEDDGRGPGPSARGSGLSGLRERVTAAGGTLAVGRADSGGLALEVTLP